MVGKPAPSRLTCTLGGRFTMEQWSRRGVLSCLQLFTSNNVCVLGTYGPQSDCRDLFLLIPEWLVRHTSMREFPLYLRLPLDHLCSRTCYSAKWLPFLFTLILEGREGIAPPYGIWREGGIKCGPAPIFWSRWNSMCSSGFDFSDCERNWLSREHNLNSNTQGL